MSDQKNLLEEYSEGVLRIRIHNNQFSRVHRVAAILSTSIRRFCWKAINAECVLQLELGYFNSLIKSLKDVRPVEWDRPAEWYSLDECDKFDLDREVFDQELEDLELCLRDRNFGKAREHLTLLEFLATQHCLANSQQFLYEMLRFYRENDVCTKTLENV